MFQDRGFGSGATWSNQIMPIEYLKKDLYESLNSIKMSNPVSELEYMIETNGSYHINVPHVVYKELSKKFDNNWVVVSASQKISLNSVGGIISAIKSTLVSFLLELEEEIGKNGSIDIMNRKQNVDNIIEKTFGNMYGKTINISIGEKSIQTVSSGQNSSITSATGENITQTINVESSNHLGDFIKELKSEIDNFSLNTDDKQDILNEISRIETQLSRPEPKYSIVRSGLEIINGILIGVAGNVVSPYFIEKLAILIPTLAS